MSFSCGIVGLPNAGKSTIFNALTGAAAQVGPYPFTTIDKNVGVVPLPDPRLDLVASAFGSRTKTPNTIQVVDIAGLVKGASRGDGLGNKFLSHIRDVDAIIHVVRCFGDPKVASAQEGSPVDPERDVSVVTTELCLADLDIVDRRIQALSKVAKSGDVDAEKTVARLRHYRTYLNQGVPLRSAGLGETWDLLRTQKELGLITGKPVVYLANVSEPGLEDEECERAVETLRALARREGAALVEVCGKIEAELAELPEDQARVFAEELGLGRQRVLDVAWAGYRALDLLTFFTANENEARAWTLRRGSTAYDAAGRVHSDMQKGFIRAEVVSCDDLKAVGSLAKAREAGLVRQEGRDYQVRDGDLLYFRFHL